MLPLHPAAELSADAHLAAAIGVPYVELHEFSISAATLRRLPTRVAIRERCVPFIDNSRRVVFAVDDAARIPWFEVQRDLLGIDDERELSLVLTSSECIDIALGRRVSIRE